MRVEVSGREVKVGDMFDTQWYGVHRVTALKPYPKWGEMFPGYTARIAEFDDGAAGGMTIPDDAVEVVIR